MHKRISVVIPTLNEEKYIGSLLDDLYKQSRKPDEIIVVDALSKDATKKIVKKKKTITFIEMKPGIAAQRNKGGETAAGDMLFFFDADVRLQKNFIQQSLREFEKKQLDIACPKYVPFNSNIIIILIYQFFNFLFWSGQYIFPSGAGSCILMKKSTFVKGKGFNKKYIFDDIELIRRYAKNYRFGMLSQAVYVSDRRFRKEGIIKTLMQYLFLSLFFLTNNFKHANRVKYKFGNYSSS